MDVTSRPRIRDWAHGVMLGAILGALVLGIGGRIAMRGVAIVQEWPPTFSFGGSATIVMFGTLAGCGFALVQLALLSIPRLPRPVAALLFWLVVAGISLRILQPIDRDRLLAFPPLVIVYGLVQQAGPKWIARRRL